MPSDWKERSIERRDFRSTRNGPEVTGKPRKRKDTKQWCKGVEGRKHVLETRMSDHGSMITGLWGKDACGDFMDSWHCQHERRCMVCGKILDWTLGDKCPNKPAVQSADD